MTAVLATECPPRFGTRRSPERATLGPAVGMVAAMLGKPLMAWQQRVADVILEIDPETGCLVYDEWLLTVPRQSGKSTFILAKSTHRGMATKFFGPRQRIVYTAQTRQKAREKWEEDYVADLEASRLRTKVHVAKGNGSEHIRYANGSRFGIEANTEKAGHGSTLDEAYIDEAFAQVDNRLEQAFGPAMITRKNKQLGVVSTAGWSDASPYLAEKVKVGRKLVRDDARRGTAYFEWSAPEDADPADPAVWLACMPALHRPDCSAKCKAHTVTIAAIRAEYDKAVRAGKLADFCRAYLNQWRPKPKESEETALGDWSACRIDFAKHIESRMPSVLAVGVASDRERKVASIASAGMLLDPSHDAEVFGRTLVAAVDRRPGTAWLGAELLRIQKAHGCAVVIDEKGPIGDLIPTLEDLGVVVDRYKLEDRIAADNGLADAVPSLVNRPALLVAHFGNPELDEAVLATRWRDVGDRKVFGRKDNTADISMAEAASLAKHKAESGSAFNVW